jgi:hypothetical protein
MKVYNSDGPGGLPGTELWFEMTGSIGNVVGGLIPGAPNWASVLIKDGPGNPMMLDQPFYISVSNPIDHKYEAFGRDNDTNAGNSFFFDGCDLQWYSEADEAPNAQGGTRMIRPRGYLLGAPVGLVIESVGIDIVLTWADSGAPFYRVYSAAFADGPFVNFVGSTSATTLTDVNAVSIDDLRFYYVVGSVTP